MGAGVDHLLRDPQLPEGIPIVRLVDPGLAQSMFEYICSCCFFYLRDMANYQKQQSKKVWLGRPAKSISEKLKWIPD